MVYHDREENRWIQRILAIAFRIAKDLSLNNAKMGCQVLKQK